MKRIMIFVILVLILPFISADVIISELMFNPNDGNEWMELFISENITHNISELTLKDNLHTGNIVYTSSSEKIKNYVLFLVIFIVFIVAYAWFKTR